MALPTDQGTPFHWKRNRAAGIGSACTGIAQNIVWDLPQDFFTVRLNSSRDIDCKRDLMSPPGFSSVRQASTSFSAPPGGPDRGFAYLFLRVRPPPVLRGLMGCPPPVVLLGRDGGLGCGPEPHLGYDPSRRHTSRPLEGVLRVFATPPPAHTGGSRHPRAKGFPHNGAGRT